jgi:transposase
MLGARAALWQEYLRPHKVVVYIVRRDEQCRRFMRFPGGGPISALAFKTATDDPHRFRRSKTVGAYPGFTPRRWQSGTTIDDQGPLSKAGGGEVCHTLYEADNIMLARYLGFCSLKAWGLKIAKKRGPSMCSRSGGAQADARDGVGQAANVPTNRTVKGR